MVFTTLKFMIFMAVVFFLYYAIPKNKQWWLLLAASYFFYACASPSYLIFLLLTTAITYGGALYIEKHEKGLWLVVTSLLLMLGIFKYTGFVAGIFGLDANGITAKLILPLGLSFYMFQSMGYVIDVSRGMAKAEHNFFKHALYVSFFPQLLQGPIGDYNRLSPQLFAEHQFDYTSVKFGLQRVAWGFFKKLAVANPISLVIDAIWAGYQDYPGIVFWFFIFILYAFQLYADFSGYMDIANGCAQMLGITLDENFDTPYFSHDIAEFWRRWHITLGTWFKNYVFYSVLRTKKVDGIRKKYRKTKPYISKTMPTVISLIVIWLLIGLWHGADWSYVLYGIFHGSFIVISTLLAPIYDKFHSKCSALCSSKTYKGFQILRTFLIVSFGYVIFRPADLSVTAGILKQMVICFGASQIPALVIENIKLFAKIIIGLIVLIVVDCYHVNNRDITIREQIGELPALARYAIYIIGVIAIIFVGSYGQSGLNQFAYFKF